MKTSRFNFKTTYQKTGETLIFNTLTGAFCAVDPGTHARIERLFERPELVSEDPKLGEFLYDRGYLVTDEMDEHSTVLERSKMGINDTNRIDVIVMPNMNCNFACTYCYESHKKSEMDDETASRLLTWLERMVPRFKVVLLSWFGGEPLLSYERVVQIQRRVLELSRANNVRFSSHITTNGYLLSAARAAELVNLECYSYQITLDGPQETHNAKRPLRGGEATFDRVMANICGLVRTNQAVSVKLRVNYDETNLERIPELLDAFPEDVRPQLDVVYERIFGEEFSKYVDKMPARRVGVTVESLYEHARRMGFSVTMNPIEPSTLTYCYADRKNEFIINYNGDVFKCTVDKFESKDRLALLQKDGTIKWEDDRLARWHAVAAFEDKCYECTFMPMCMGGCRKVRWREGTVGDDCKLPFMGFDKRLQYRYAKERGDNIVAPLVLADARPSQSSQLFRILDR
jgi:uncharacterized protein